MDERETGNENASDVRPELLEQFEEWKKTQSSHGPADAGSATFDGEAALLRARRTRQIRWFTLLVVATLSAMGLWGSRMDIAYFFSSSEVASLGDLRVQYVENKLEQLPVGSNSHVQADGLIATLIHDSEKHQYFFCPLYNLLVRTPTPVRLPLNKVVHEIDPVDEQLLLAQMALVWELAVDVSVQGRLVALADLPGRWTEIWRNFAPEVEGVDASQVMVLIDGGPEDEERPGAYLGQVLVALLSLGFVGFTMFFYRRARRDEDALIEALSQE